MHAAKLPARSSMPASMDSASADVQAARLVRAVRAASLERLIAASRAIRSSVVMREQLMTPIPVIRLPHVGVPCFTIQPATMLAMQMMRSAMRVRGDRAR